MSNGPAPNNPLSFFLGSFAAARKMGQVREMQMQVAELGAQRFESIGSPEAQQMADLYRQNPMGFYNSAEQFGGIAKLEDALRNQFQQRQASELIAGAGPETSERDLAVQLTPILGADKAFQAADDWAKSRLPERKIMRDAAGYLRDVDTGERIFPGVISKSERAKGARELTPAQERENEEIEKARQYVLDYLDERGYSMQQRRTILGRGPEFWANIENAGEDPLVARTFRKAWRAKIGPDPERDQFLEQAIGLEGTELPRTQEGMISAEDLIPGMIYNVNGQRLRWNPDTQIFEDLR